MLFACCWCVWRVAGSHRLQQRRQVDERLSRGESSSSSSIVHHPSAHSLQTAAAGAIPASVADGTGSGAAATSPSAGCFYRKRMEGAVGPLLQQGSALLYDYRVSEQNKHPPPPSLPSSLWAVSCVCVGVTARSVNLFICLSACFCNAVLYLRIEFLLIDR